MIFQFQHGISGLIAGILGLTKMLTLVTFPLYICTFHQQMMIPLEHLLGVDWVVAAGEKTGRAFKFKAELS
jgi:hypothetical protein